MYIEDPHIQGWITRIGASVLSSEISAEFSEFLESLPWTSSHVNWHEISGVKFKLVDGWEGQVLEFSKECPMGRHEYMMAMFNGSEPSILCPTDVGLRDVDLIYSGAPGSRYICGVDLRDGVPVPRYGDFAEFDGMENLIFVMRVS